jgi:hypothetical protein
MPNIAVIPRRGEGGQRLALQGFGAIEIACI